MNQPTLRSSRRLLTRAGLPAALLLASSLPALALQWQNGELKVHFDTTLSFGIMERLNDPNPDYYGITNSFNGVYGTQYSVNGDDGDLNNPKGLVSQLAKVSHDLDIRYGNYGAFVRGFYFYDFQVKQNWEGRTALSKDALNHVGSGAQWLDMYTFGKFDFNGTNVDLRLGRQVLSLGESTFIPNGINVVNAVDLARLRVPGAELKEALLPVNMIKASIGIGDKLTVEPFWLLEFRRNEIEPAGTYFSTNDFVSRGGEKVMLGFGALSDQGTLGYIPRSPNREGGNFNQGGIAAHYNAAGLGDTDLGFYYVHYHSRSPLISATTPTGPINTDLTGPLTQVLLKSAGSNPSAAVIAAAQAQASAIYQAYVLSKTNPAALTATQLGMLQSSSVQAALAGAGQIAFLTDAATGRYYTEFPEGIDMLGLSFNTNLAHTGIAWQGEIAYKHGVPLQVDDVELLFAALSSINSAYGASNQIGNYLGQYSKDVQGWRRKDVWTAQTTMTKVFGPAFGASQFTVVGEVGGTFVNLPSKDVLRFDAPGTYTSGSAAFMTSSGNGSLPATPRNAFADRFSCGYQLLTRADYNNLFWGINLAPSIAFTHDVMGTTPLPLGTYVRGRKSFTLGAEFNFQNHWTLDLRYVNFFGGGRYNLLADRDYVSATLKYSF